MISIDGGSDKAAEVRQVAEEMEWSHGPFSVVEQEPLGLVGHFQHCGDLTQRYGSVIFLEDDLIVGPEFYRWACAALAQAKSDERIAGVCLAAPFHDGYRHLPFEPVLDGSDAIYAQVPWYDGMAWTRDMWARYRAAKVDATTSIHRAFDQLDDDEWFPHAVRYLVQTGRFYLLPRHAHATNSGAAGAHFETETNYFQVSLSLRGPTSWRFSSLDESLAVYDDHMELTPRVVAQLVPELASYDLTIDLLGTRDLSESRAPHVLTTRQTSSLIRAWGSSLHPLVANVVAGSPGDSIRLAAIEDVISSPESDRTAEETLRIHADRGRQPTNRDAVAHLVSKAQDRIRRVYER